MTDNEIKLIKMIRECTNPAQALVVAIQTILLFLTQQ